MRSKKNSHRALWPLSVIFVFLTLAVFPSGTYAAIYDVYGKYTKGGTEYSPPEGFWPTDGAWRAVSSLGDPDDGLTERLDFVGDTYTGGPGGTYYAFYTYSGAYDVGDGYGSQYYAYFRLRVDEGTYTASAWADTISIMIDGDANGTTDYALAWDTKGKDGSVIHGLEFQVVKTDGTTWGGTDFDDVDMDSGKKLVNWTTCDGTTCWYVDIPYVAWLYGTEYFAGYMRAFDNQSAGIWGTTMFIDFAVSWDYLIAASTAAHAKRSSLPILSKSGNWKLQMGSIHDANDHVAFNVDVGGNSTITAKVWSSSTPTLVELASFTATPSLNSILLQWETASEIDNAGFHVWRGNGGNGLYARITDTLIPAQGGPAWGAAYAYNDWDVKPGATYVYQLEDIDTAGQRKFHGPVSAWAGVANIEANGSDGPVVVAAEADLSVTASIQALEHTGTPVEFWVAAYTPFGWWSYGPGGWVPDIVRAAAMPLADIRAVKVLQMPLPAGAYTFYLAVDDQVNGQPDLTWIDSVEVKVE